MYVVTPIKNYCGTLASRFAETSGGKLTSPQTVCVGGSEVWFVKEVPRGDGSCPAFYDNSHYEWQLAQMMANSIRDGSSKRDILDIFETARECVALHHGEQHV